MIEFAQAIRNQCWLHPCGWLTCAVSGIRVSGAVGSRRGAPVGACVLGLVLIIAGLLVLSRLDGTSAYWLLLAGLLPLGAGMGLAMTPAITAITDALPVAQEQVGSAMNDLARELGGALGIAVLGSVLQSTYRQGW